MAIYYMNFIKFSPLRFFLLITALFIFINNFVHSNGSKRIIDIKERIFCNDPIVRFSDIVVNPGQITDDEKKLTIITTSKTNREESISLTLLAYQLQRYPTMMNVYLRGPKSVIISGKNDRKHLNQSKKIITSEINRKTPWDDWTIDVSFDYDDEQKILEAGVFSSAELKPTNNRNLLGNVPFQISYYDEYAKLILKNTISPIITRQIQTVVLANGRERGHILSQSELKTVPIWIGDARNKYLTDLNYCIGRELNRSLSSGDILRANDLLSPIHAKRGDVVWVTYSVGSLSVRVATTALESGRKGESIKVKNNDSKKILTVELVGDKNAIIHIGKFESG